MALTTYNGKSAIRSELLGDLSFKLLELLSFAHNMKSSSPDKWLSDKMRAIDNRQDKNNNSNTLYLGCALKVRGLVPTRLNERHHRHELVLGIDAM